MKQSMKKVWLWGVLGFILLACEEMLPEGVQATPTPILPALPAPGAKPSDLESFMTTLMGTTSKTWQLVKRMEGQVDMSLECYLDDQIKISRDRRIEFLTGASLCRTEGAATKNLQGGWQITTELNLVVNLTDTLPYEIKILSLKAREMQIFYFSNTGKHVTETYVAVDTGSEAMPTPSTSLSPRPVDQPGPTQRKTLGFFPQ